MKLEYVASASISGDPSKPNDDAYCHTDTIAAVFDGATNVGNPVLPADSDAAWIARKGAERLVANDILGARGALKKAAKDAERDFNANKLRETFEPYELPRSAMMLIAPEGDGFLALWFADCAALVKRPGEKAELIGDAIGERSSESSRAAKLAKETGLAPTSKDRTPFLPILQKSRARQNTVDGTWCFSPVAACAEHAESKAFEAPAGTLILLCSDGFLAAASDYGLYDVDGLMEAALTKGLRAVVDEIRVVEEADREGSKFPRFKVSDDATALIVRVI